MHALDVLDRDYQAVSFAVVWGFSISGGFPWLAQTSCTALGKQWNPSRSKNPRGLYAYQTYARICLGC